MVSRFIRACFTTKTFYLSDNNAAKAINAFAKVRTLRPVTTRALW